MRTVRLSVETATLAATALHIWLETGRPTAHPETIQNAITRINAELARVVKEQQDLEQGIEPYDFD